MEEFIRGEIYYIMPTYQEQGCEQRAGRPAIIVSNDKGNQYSGIVEVVYLTTQPKHDLPTHIDIKSAAKPSIALCEQISTISKDRVGSYIGTCTDYELQMLNAALLISLGIELPTPKIIEKVVEVPKADEELKQPMVNYDDYIKSQIERDTYKKLYEGLLEKVIGSRVVG